MLSQRYGLFLLIAFITLLTYTKGQPVIESAIAPDLQVPPNFQGIARLGPTSHVFLVRS